MSGSIGEPPSIFLEYAITVVAELTLLQERLAAAYFASTDIPPAEAVIVQETTSRGIAIYLQRRSPAEMRRWAEEILRTTPPQCGSVYFDSGDGTTRVCELPNEPHERHAGPIRDW